MAIDAKVLVVRARELAEVYQPCPELGIDWWDVPEYCPFHGFAVEPCNCRKEAADVAVIDADIIGMVYDLSDAKADAAFGRALWFAS